MHLSSAWLQTKENLLPVYGGRDFDLWFSLVFFPLFVSPLDIFKGSVVPFRFPRSNFYAVLFLPSFSRAWSRLFIAALGDLLAHLSASSDFFDAVSFASLEISPLFSFFFFVCSFDLRDFRPCGFFEEI